MTERDVEPGGGRRLSRRAAGRAAVGLLAGTLAASSGEAQPEKKPEPPVPGPDTRLALIEKSRGKLLTEQERRRVLESIRSTDEGWEEGRQFPGPDGTEPDFVFQPTPLPPAPGTKSVLRKEDR